MLAGCNRLGQRGYALLCCCRIEKHRKARLCQRLIEIGCPAVDVMGASDFGEPLGIAPDQKEVRHNAIGAGRQATFCADR